MSQVSKQDGSRREQIGNEIALLMGPLVRELRAALLGCGSELELTPGETQALWLLGARGSLQTNALARALDVDPANTSTLVTRLERRGLLRREEAADDRRKRLVSLTRQGHATRRRLAACVAARRPSFRGLTTEELATFRDLLRRVADERDAY